MRLHRNGALRAAWILLLLIPVASCGNDTAERRPVYRLRALLGQAPDTGTVLQLAVGDTMRVSPQTLGFYRRIRFRPAWLKGSQPGERADSILYTIARAEDDGLSPQRYGHDVAQRILAALDEDDDDTELSDSARAAYLGDLDVVLSEGYMRYAADVVAGTIAPDDAEHEWRIPRTDVVTERVLRSIVRGGSPSEIIDGLRPATPHYGRLMAALQRLREIRAAGGWPVLPEDADVAEGDSGNVVIVLRQRLMRSDDPREAALAQRGQANAAVLDRDLRDALRHFQRRHAIDDDGRIGSKTLRELNHTVDDRIAEVALNLDRWRWLPARLGDFFLMVNIAGFELEVIERDRVIEAMNVVVGKPGWNTPVFADTLQHVVVNPYWTPTPSIIEEEILPAIERDPSYLQRNGFERTSDGGFRQRPGPRNALGNYKFLFPNQYDIYLHDTPADHLFSQARRDFSHGCIRVERPADLARLLVSRASTHSAASLDALVGARAEKWIPLKRDIPIYIVYFTAWVKEDGTLLFHHDVYGHNEDLEQKLQPDSAQRQRVAAVSAGG